MRKIVFTTAMAILLSMTACGKSGDAKDILLENETVTIAETEETTVEETFTENISIEEIVSEEVSTEEASEEIAEEDGLPEYYQTYQKLLIQFMHDPNASMIDVLEMSTFQEGMQFAVKDINDDGREELIVGYPEGTYNLLIPASSWNEANLGPFNYYDEETGQIAWVDGEFGGGVSYYVLKGDALSTVDTYFYSEGDTEEINWEYYHNDQPITRDEFLHQPAFVWQELSADWYDINDRNIRNVLRKESDLDIEYSENRNEEKKFDMISLDAGKTGPVLTYKVNGEVKTTEFDYSTESEVFSFFYEYGYQLGDLDGDGVNEVVISMYFENNVSEGVQDTFVYAFDGEDLVEILHVEPEMWFEHNCLIDGVSIENGLLNIEGIYKDSIEGEPLLYIENKYLKYEGGKWSMCY